ncbi:MAG: glycoside hydrolase family 3 N-terminal domain-containing protein [Novosphingobium sp.]
MSVRKWLAGAGAAVFATSAALLWAQPSPTDPNAAVAHPRLWPEAHSPSSISDAQTEAQIDALLAKMSLEQKVGQMIQGDISSVAPADLSRYPLGSILAGGNSGPYGDERANPATWRKMVAEYRTASRNAGAGIPVLFGVDAVHGHSNLPGATIFPHNIGLGAAHDPALVRRIGAATAAEVAGTGIEWTFAPTLAQAQDLRWGRSYESYSSDSVLVAGYSRAMTLGLQGSLAPGRPLGPRAIAATAKHYIADGGTADGRDQGDAKISEQTLVSRHASGYPAAIDAGALTVMASFSSWNGAKHHGNQSLLTGVLKQRMGFSGLVVGDWNGHGQVPGCSATHCPAAINAGVDLLMAPDSWRGLFDATVEDVKAGRISMTRVDDAVRRILRVKFKLGLMGPNPVERGDVSQVGAPDHLALAREAVAKSLVLLKNNRGLLPLTAGSRVLIAGSGADNMAMQAGGWTITWQGGDTTAADFPNGQTVGRALAAAVSANGGQANLSADGAYVSKPDVAVVVVGERPYAEYNGDLPNLAFRTDDADQALITRLRAQGIKVVIVFLSGRPLFVGKLINQADAFVAAWLPGTQGSGIADVLVADRAGKTRRDFTGRLPFAWPGDARSPVTKPLFARGYGLDYRHARWVGRVNETPGVDLAAQNAATTLLTRGAVPAPWHISSDGNILVRQVDLAAQEDARQFTWTGPGAVSLEGPPVNFASWSTSGALELLWRVPQPVSHPLTLTFGGGSIVLGQDYLTKLAGVTATTRIPLRCFVQSGATLDRVAVPLRLEAAPGFVVAVSSAKIVNNAASENCPPPIR